MSVFSANGFRANTPNMVELSTLLGDNASRQKHVWRHVWKRPVASNETSAGQDANRRVEVAIYASAEYRDEAIRQARNQEGEGSR